MTVEQLGRAAIAVSAAMVLLACVAGWIARELDRGVTLPEPAKHGWLR